MQKFLVAAAALAVSAGFAVAEGITISGDARMGIDFDEAREDANVASWQMTSRARVTFTLSGVTDTGLRFGASFRADNAGEAVGNNAMTGGEVFISGAFGTLTMGDAAGAARARVGDLDFTSLTGLGDPNEMQYIDRLEQAGFLGELDDDGTLDVTGRRTAVRFDYMIDGFTFSVSLDQFRRVDFDSGTFFAPDDFPGDPDDFDSTARVRGWAVGVSHDFGIGSISAGYEEARASFSGAIPIDDELFTHTIVGAEATFEGITVKGIYGRAGGSVGRFLTDANLSRDQYGASVSGSFDGITVTAFGNRDFLRAHKMGIGASFDLGGGARVIGSVARVRGFDVPFDAEDRSRVSRTRADFGVAMTF